MDWVNNDLLRMAEDLEKQAQGIDDESDYKRPRRRQLREAAIHLRQAFQQVSDIPAQDISSATSTYTYSGMSVGLSVGLDGGGNGALE